MYNDQKFVCESTLVNVKQLTETSLNYVKIFTDYSMNNNLQKEYITRVELKINCYS